MSGLNLGPIQAGRGTPVYDWDLSVATYLTPKSLRVCITWRLP